MKTKKIIHLCHSALFANFYFFLCVLETFSAPSHIIWEKMSTDCTRIHRNIRHPYNMYWMWQCTGYMWVYHVYVRIWAIWVWFGAFVYAVCSTYVHVYCTYLPVLVKFIFHLFLAVSTDQRYSTITWISSRHERMISQERNEGRKLYTCYNRIDDGEGVRCSMQLLTEWEMIAHWMENDAIVVWLWRLHNIHTHVRCTQHG